MAKTVGIDLGTTNSVVAYVDTEEGEAPSLRMLPIPQQPDYFLVVVRSSEIGHLDVGPPSWRSEGTLLISFSECR